MNGAEIKKKAILTILKFNQITGENVLKIQREEFFQFSDAEIISALKNLEKNKLIEILDDRAIRGGIDVLMYKANNMFNLKIEIKILDGFKKYVEDNDLNKYLGEDKSSVMLKATYNHRKLKINEITIAKPHFDSENDYFAMFIMNNPNKKLTVDDFKKFKNSDITKKFDQIITDLGFKGNIKKLFFPNISIKAVEFKNPITSEDMQKNGVEEILSSDFSRKK